MSYVLSQVIAYHYDVDNIFHVVDIFVISMAANDVTTIYALSV